MTRMKKKITGANLELNKIISKNLRKLIVANGTSEGELCRMLEQQGKISMDRTLLNKIINHPDQNSISLIFLVSIADYFNVSVDDILKDDFDSEHIYNNQNGHKILNYIESKNVNSEETMEEHHPYFETNPHSPFFKKYLQKYFCYYYSTVAAENKRGSSILSGTFEIYGEDVCYAKMRINTKKKNENGELNYKEYEGTATYCPTSQTIQCVMRDKKIGECCYVIFRYSQVNYSMQACRMAEVLSTSSIPDKRFPVVHRMLISREEIKHKDLKLVESQLCLNYSEIIINKHELNLIKNQDEKYDKVVKELENINTQEVYILKEGELRSKAEKYLSDVDVIKFVSKLRKSSFAYRYNKVSSRVDENIWAILHDAGYYKELVDDEEEEADQLI